MARTEDGLADPAADSPDVQSRVPGPPEEEIERPTLRRYLDLAIVVTAAQGGSVMLVHPKTRLLDVAAARGLNERFTNQVQMALGQPIAGWVAATGTPLLLNGRRTLRALVGSREPRPDVRSAMCIPIRAEHEPLGVLNLNNRLPSGRFTEDDIRRALPLGTTAALMLELARLAVSGRAAIRQRDQHRAQLLAAREDERRWVARELHDNSLQSLADVALRLSACQRLLAAHPAKVRRELRAITGALRATIKEIRMISQGQSSPIVPEGLRRALQSSVFEFERRTGTTATLHWSGDPGGLRPEVEASVFRIVQEALTNVRKHARARRADVRLQVADGWLLVTVEDDGVGFVEPAPRRPHASGLGLAGIRERVRLLGGHVEISGPPRRGTTLKAGIPIQAADGPQAQDGIAGSA